MESLPSGFSRGAAQAHYSASVSKYFQCVALSTGSLEKIGQQLKMELIVCLLKRPTIASQEYQKTITLKTLAGSCWTFCACYSKAEPESDNAHK